MNKKNNLALYVLLVAGFLSLFTLNTLAQESATAKSRQLQKINLKNVVLQNYISASSLPIKERRNFFGNLSAEEKANLFKLHLALQIVKRPNLTNEQKDLILEGISIATPDAYDKNNPEKLEKSRQDAKLFEQKMLLLFSKSEGIEIFADLGGGTTEINLLQKYLDISALSVPKRMELLQKVSVKDKSNLWRVHLVLHLAEQPELNSQQMQVILEAIIFVSPELYEIPKNSLEWKVKVDEPVKLLRRRALEVFSKNDVAKIFGNLGGKNPSLNDTSQTTNLK